MTLQEQRLQTDCNVFIDLAIAMLKEEMIICHCGNNYSVAGYNGIVSLLQYAKESHLHAMNNQRIAETITITKMLPFAAPLSVLQDRLRQVHIDYPRNYKKFEFYHIGGGNFTMLAFIEIEMPVEEI